MAQAQPSTAIVDPVVDPQLEALRAMAANADELSHSLKQLQAQCLFLARAINDAIAALPSTTTGLVQA